jgi:hypothetical protein
LPQSARRIDPAIAFSLNVGKGHMPVSLAPTSLNPLANPSGPDFGLLSGGPCARP